MLRMLAMICAAGAVSYALNPSSGIIAVASVVAFIVSSMTDTAVFSAMKGNSWTTRANASNVVSAMVDSILFPTIAFGVLMPAIVASQFSMKVLGGALWAYVLGKIVESQAPHK